MLFFLTILVASIALAFYLQALATRKARSETKRLKDIQQREKDRLVALTISTGNDFRPAPELLQELLDISERHSSMTSIRANDYPLTGDNCDLSNPVTAAKMVVDDISTFAGEVKLSAIYHQDSSRIPWSVTRMSIRFADKPEHRNVLNYLSRMDQVEVVFQVGGWGEYVDWVSGRGLAIQKLPSPAV